MMTILARLIGVSVLGSMVMVSFALTGLLTVFTLLEQVGELDQRYTFTAALIYVGLSVPRLLYETLPYAILIGALISLGGFALRSELVAMRAAGVSVYRILGFAMVPALIISFMGVLIGEYLLPDAERLARLERRQATSAIEAISPEYGIWLRDQSSFLHVESMSGEEMTGLRWLVFDSEKRLIEVRTAQLASYVSPAEGIPARWQLFDVTRTEYGLKETRRHQDERAVWQTELTPEEISSELLVEPSRMSIGSLARRISALDKQALDTSKYQLGFWVKLLQPLTALALLALSAAMVFGPLRDASMGLRVFSGLLLGVGFKFVQDLLSPLTLVYGLPPILAVLVPTIVCLGFAYYQLRRVA